MVHNFLQDTKNARRLLEYGLTNYKLFHLKRRYEDLLRGLTVKKT